MAAPPKKEPRLVQIGLNLISLLDVDDKTHSFEANVLMHVFWDARPMVEGMPYFRPWIQVHNVKSLEEIANEGMTQYHRHELQDKVKAEMEKNARNGKPNAPVNVFESRNFVAKFVSTLDLRSFPFDQQNLRITIMSNMTSDVTFSHKVPRDPETKRAKPLLDAQGNVIFTIKCNLEGDTLSEWDVLLQNGKTLELGSTPGVSTPAVVCYDFKEHDKTFSAEGAVYQRLDYYVYVERELKNMMVTIILPTCMLSASALCVFALDIMEARGDRFSVLFTVVLTIVANQFVTQGRLPYLAYFTWLDGCMLFLQFFVYGIIVETAVCENFAEYQEMTPHEVDKIALWVMLGVFGLGMLIGIVSGLKLYRARKQRMAVAEIQGKASFEREELRLRKLWFPHEFKKRRYEQCK